VNLKSTQQLLYQFVAGLVRGRVELITHFFGRFCAAVFCQQAKGISGNRMISGTLSIFFLAYTLVDAPRSAWAAGPQDQDYRYIPDEKGIETGDLILSYVDAYLANGKAIKSGDCLVMIERVFDSIGEGKLELDLEGTRVWRVELMRLRFDYDQRFFLRADCHMTDRLDLGVFDPATGQHPRKSNDLMFQSVMLGENKVEAFVNGQLVTYSADDVSAKERLVNGNLVDLRGFCLWNDIFCGLENGQRWVMTNRAQRGAGRIESAGDKIRTLLYGPTSKRVWEEIVFDKKTLMPLHRSMRVHEPNSFGGIAWGSDRFDMEWTTVSGLHLANVITAEGIETMTVGNNELTGNKTITVHFDWLAVNPTELDFDHSLRNVKEIRDFLDPNANGAARIGKLLGNSKMLDKNDQSIDSPAVIK